MKFASSALLLVACSAFSKAFVPVKNGAGVSHKISASKPLNTLFSTAAPEAETYEYVSRNLIICTVVALQCLTIFSVSSISTTKSNENNQQIHK